LQLTLLTGQKGESANQLYTLSSIYFAASLLWWSLYRRIQSVYVLSMPFVFFGSALLFLAASVYVDNPVSKGWLHNVTSGLYSVGSAAGSFYFSLNFGTEGMLFQSYAWV
jgi:alpha-1,3-glucan synthase